jgi:hypothetical protein
MNSVLQLWQPPIAILAGWSNRQQQEVIEYLLVTVYLLFVMELATRRIHFASCTGLPPFYVSGRLRHPQRQALLLNRGVARARLTYIRPSGVRESRPSVRASANFFVGETTTFS